jgi:hypothetical protein
MIEFLLKEERSPENIYQFVDLISESKKGKKEDGLLKTESEK